MAGGTALGAGHDGAARRLRAVVLAAGLALRAALAGGAGAGLVGQPLADDRAAARGVAERGARELRLIARRTWRFFETFVTPADNMLPPDNFQEDPKPAVAHRTSPTNIGLYLLSAVAARDFGWAGTLETVERLEATFGTMEQLARFKGHFFNWYDTHDLAAAGRRLCVVGRQRQSRRPPDRARQCLRRMDRPRRWRRTPRHGMADHLAAGARGHGRPARRERRARAPARRRPRRDRDAS